MNIIKTDEKSNSHSGFSIGLFCRNSQYKDFLDSKTSGGNPVKLGCMVLKKSEFKSGYRISDFTGQISLKAPRLDTGCITQISILIYSVTKATLTILFGRRAPTRVFCALSEEKNINIKAKCQGFFSRRA